jgi:hypothetical protein
MKFWDSSAILPLLVSEPASFSVEALAREDAVLVVWWSTRVECCSGLARRVREGGLDECASSQSRTVLASLSRTWTEVLPAEAVRQDAERLLAAHELRAANALQLAAALQWCGGESAGAGFVCLDERLRLAAGRCGFTVVPA